MNNTVEDDLINRAVALAKLEALVIEDPALRERLLADPRSVLREIAGVELPDTTSLVVHEAGAEEFHLVVPPAARADAVSDDDLESVSGGMNFGVYRMFGEKGPTMDARTFPAVTKALGEDGGGNTPTQW